MKYLTAILLAFSFQMASAKDFKTSIKVNIQMPERASKVVVVVPERDLGKEEATPPLWKVADKNFDEMVKEFKALPKSPDSPTECPRNNLGIELIEGKRKTLKFSCYNKANETRKKYISFAQKLN